MIQRVRNRNTASSYIQYICKRNGKVIGEVLLQKEKNTDWVYIAFLHVYDKRKGYGTKVMKELFSTLPYKKYYGDSTYELKLFWEKLGAVYVDNLDGLDLYDDCEVFTFEIELK